MLCGAVVNIIIAPKMKIPQSCTKHAQKCGGCLKKKTLPDFTHLPRHTTTHRTKLIKTEYLVGRTKEVLLHEKDRQMDKAFQLLLSPDKSHYVKSCSCTTQLSFPLKRLLKLSVIMG